MGKALGKIAIGAALVGAAFLTGGASILPSVSTVSVGGVAVGGVAAALSTTALGSLALTAGGGLLLSGAAQAAGLGPKLPKASLSQLDRLNASVSPSAYRKIAFGSTAMATDIRYVEPAGTNQEYIHYIIAVASHRVANIREIWFEDLQGWSSASGPMGKYAGYLTVQVRTEGTAANAITIEGGTKWAAGNRRLTGCAYVHLRIKRTGNSKKAESPFTGGLPSRLTIIGDAMPLYDPRRDSTVPGGSGPMRANDQSTWAYTSGGVTLGENTALQILAYLLGWKINGKLAVGAGMPPARIDLTSFVTAANLCDEPVTLAGGGTQARYASAGVFSEGDDPNQVLNALCGACNGSMLDRGGKLGLLIRHNDLAAAAADEGLGDDDVLSGFEWDPDASLDGDFNVVRGRFTDPSTTALYQPNDYPEIRIASPDGKDRVLPLDQLLVESGARAQRIAKQVLQRRQYPGLFRATFGPEAWRYRVGDVLPLTFSPLGFDRKLFRVVQQQPYSEDGGAECPMVLRVEHASIYAWDNDDRAAVTAAEPIRYDALNNPVILAIDDASQTASWPQITGEGKPEDGATVGAPAGTPVAGRPAEDVVDDLAAAIDTISEEVTRGAVWRGESDDILYTADGTPVRVVVEAIGTTVNGHETFVAFLKEVSGDGTARFMFSARADGSIVGIEGFAGGGFDQLSFVASRFLFVDNSGANPVSVLTYEGGVWKLKSIEVDTLKVNTIIKGHVQAGELNAAATFTAADAMLGTGEVTLIETAQFTPGDAIYGAAIAQFTCVHDASTVKDNTALVRAYVDTGSGYELARPAFKQGLRTASGDTFHSGTFGFNLTINATAATKIKVTIQATSMPGGDVNTGSYFREPRIDVFTGSR